MASKRRPAVVRRLSLDLGLLVAALCLVFFGIYSLRDSQARKTIAETYATRSVDRALKEYQETFEAPIISDLNRIRDWGASGLLMAKDPLILNKIFRPIVRENGLIRQLNLADSTGYRYMLRHVGDEWHTQMVSPDTLEGLMRYIISTDDGEILGDKAMVDPAGEFGNGVINRPDESDKDKIEWSSLYVNSELGEEAISVSTYWHNPTRGTRVMSVEVLMNDLFGKVASMSAEGPGTVFLLNNRGDVLMPSEQDPKDGKWSPMVVSIDDLPDGAIKASLKGAGSLEDRALARETKFDTEVSWSAFRSVDPGESLLWIGFVVLENEVTDLVEANDVEIIYVGFSILIIAFVFGWFIVRKYRHQLKDLPGKSLKRASSDEEIINLIAKDESPSLEFKSTMRKNLRSGKKDKAIEIAFLKGIVGFMNTDGGTLLIGVNDDGEIVGTEEDEFENDDKCRLHFKNLFRQHIGMEFSKYVEFFLKEIEGKTIAVVVCQRSKEAVFLKHEKKETFYIRNGPSSEELAPSKVLSRMQGRG